MSKVRFKNLTFIRANIMVILLLSCLLYNGSMAKSTEDELAPRLFGIHVESQHSSVNEKGVNVLEADYEINIRLFGENIHGNTIVAFTDRPGEAGDNCDDYFHSEPHKIDVYDSNMAFLSIKLPIKEMYYLCIKAENNVTNSRWYHQGNEKWLTITVEGRLLPMPVQIALIVCLLCLSGLFAGLNLGLMSLDKNELKVIGSKGSESEKRYAKIIEPIRSRGNFLLCTILLSNVLINSTLTVLLDQLTTGLIAVIVSTLSIVIVGDIVPQAICSRHGLAIGAKTVWITYIFMFLTSPLSYPISKILDVLLGDEIGQVYDRERLMEYIRITKDYSQLEQSEMNIISGALELRKKTVGEIMTRLEDVFMLPIQALLDFDTVSQIQRSGYSRIPVYADQRKNIVALFYAKDLAFVDPDDKMPLKTVIEFYRHALVFTFDDTRLDVALSVFKQGKSHLAFVRHLYDSDATDPYYEITGVVTLEDVIEEILQTEIVDETDTLTDNRLKQRIKEPRNKNFIEFAKLGEGLGTESLSPQMILATYQFLSSTCLPFTEKFLTGNMLRRLISHKIYFREACDEDDDGVSVSPIYLYEEDKPVDFFIMILEGRVKVTASKEHLTFFSGPFSYFGIDSLRADDDLSDDDLSFLFIPDYTVQVVKTASYIKIDRKLYISALKASQMERISRDAIGNHVDKNDHQDQNDSVKKDADQTVVELNDINKLN